MLSPTDTAPSVTLADVLSWGPCNPYDEARLRELAAGRERITAMEVLDLPIPARDRLWCVLRPELVPEPLLHEFACRCAERALLRERGRGREPDARSWAAIEARRAWLRGEATDGQLAAAWAAAWAAGAAAWDASDAARAAAWAAWAAAWDAAGAAAEVAAWAAWAAWAAASDAAGAAAWAASDAAGAAGAAEREEQVADLKSLIAKEDGC